MTLIEADRAAPVVESAEVHIDAPVDTVWRLLTDIRGWPGWNRGVSKVVLSGPVESGGSFIWVAGGMKIVSRFEQVDPPHRLAWSGRTRGISAVHVWDLAQQENATLVRTEESFDGLIAKLFPGFMARTLRRALGESVADLKNAAERRAAGNSEAP